jgi:uncharacterized protein (DUF302 family)
MQYYLSKFLDCGFDEACEKVRGAAQAQGFGIPMEIDFTAMMLEKLGAEVRPYRIIGTCNPQLAFDAVQAEPWIGILLPCNWVVRRHEDGRVEVAVMNPALMLSATGNEELGAVAAEAAQRLTAALDALH